jgi:hypothetical protein
MTKKDLFKIILKLFGLFAVVEVLIQIPGIIFYLSTNNTADMDWYLTLFFVMSILVTVVLLFKPEIIISIFRLDKGFETNEVSVSSINEKTIIKIAIIVIGLFLVIRNLVDFLTHLVLSFKESVAKSNLDTLVDVINSTGVNYSVLINSSLQILLGFLLLTNYNTITSWIEKFDIKKDK